MYGSKVTKALRSAAITMLLVVLIISGAATHSAKAAHTTTDSDTAPNNISTVSVPTAQLDPDVALQWMKLLYQCVADESYTPPVASRVYAYTGIALYESVLPGMPDNVSLGGQLRDLDMLPKPDASAVYDWSSSANGAMYTVINGLMPGASDNTVKQLTDLRDRLLAKQKETLDAAIVDRSFAYGETVGKAILEWASRDNYDRIEKIAYKPLSTDAFAWTPAEGKKPIEPSWGAMRPFVMTDVSSCDVPLTMKPNTVVGSDYYTQVNEVRMTVYGLTNEQKMIAQFWSDDPHNTGTPAGHWVYITAEMVNQFKLKLDKTAETYVLVGLSLGDAFISTWREKYQYNLLRPIAFIQKHINAQWKSFLPTPNFPEYPSGHSVVSGAAAAVLTNIFGKVAFTDRTNVVIGLPERSFPSFEAAAQEAAISRLYGGIHYRISIDNGLKQGKCVGQAIFDQIKLHKS